MSEEIQYVSIKLKGIIHKITFPSDNKKMLAILFQVSFVLATLQSGSRGTQACINAAHTVSGIIADLDTTIMFATAGTLNADGDSSFADHR